MVSKQEITQLLERMAELHQQDSISNTDLQEIVDTVYHMPFRVRVMQKLGELYLRAEREAEAIDAFLRVGLYYLEQEMLPKASATFKHILKLEPHHWKTHEHLAEVYLKEERLTEAVDEYRWISRYFYQEGDLERAAQYRYKIIELQPENIVQYVKLAEILIEAKRPNEAIVQFELALELLEERRYWSDLIKVADRLLYLSPHHLYALKLSARIHLENNSPMKALALLRSALKQSPEDPEVLKLLTIAFDKIEQPGKTISVLHKLADVYEGREQLELAREAYSAILQRDPDDHSSKESLAVLTAMSTEERSDSLNELSSLPVSEASASRGGLLSARRAEEIHKQLQHCNVRPEQLSAHLLEKIEHRKPPLGRKLSQWPEDIRRRVDGEILYDQQYLLLDVLRCDVFGTLYRAVDINHSSYDVCILRPHFSEKLIPKKQEFVKGWKAQVATFLEYSHPHLLSVLAGGVSEGGCPYLVTEYYDGEPLTSVRDALSPLPLFASFYQLVHTVEYLHSLGTIHGNISPSYVLRNKAGEIKLDGFALMSLLGPYAEILDRETEDSESSPSDEQPLMVTTAQFTGTPGFMAPELLEGEAISRSSDVFSLGCLLYSMVQHECPPWSVERQVGEVLYTAITRSKDDPVPELYLGEAPHAQFLEELLPQMLAYLPQARISLHELRAKYASFVQRDEHSLYRSTEAGSTDSHFSPQLSSASSSRWLEDDDVKLPSACLELPVTIQQELQQLLSRVRQLQWFQPQEDAISRGAEHLQTFLQHISPFANAPLLPQVSFVRTRWDTLQSRLVQALSLEEVVRESVEATLADDPNSWALAGRAAWDAIHSFDIPEGHLLPFDVASIAVSSSAWSAAWSPVWAGARSTAWNTAKAIAKASGRTAAWNAAKTAAWTASWPVAKSIAPPEMRTCVRAAASDVSWCAAWLVASDQLSDQPNPFASLFSIWELGLYPMLLFNGNYVLIAIDGGTGDDFEITPYPLGEH